MRDRRLTFFAMAVLLLSGCGALIRTRYSQAKIEDANKGPILTLEHLEVHAEAGIQDQISFLIFPIPLPFPFHSRAKSVPPTVVALTFRPRSPGITFTPQDTELILSTGSFVPNKMVGPYKIARGARRPPLADVPTEPIVLDNNQLTGVYLYFDVNDPLPSDNFRLRIKGLSKDGDSIVVPEIQFQPAKRWNFEFLP